VGVVGGSVRDRVLAWFSPGTESSQVQVEDSRLKGDGG
jgi:hypothetical protein